MSYTDDAYKTDIAEDKFDPNFRPGNSSKLHFILQSEVNDLVRDLGLSKHYAELLDWQAEQVLHIFKQKICFIQIFTELKVWFMFFLI